MGMTGPDGKITILHVWSGFKGDYPLFTQVVRGLGDGYRHIVCYLAGPPAIGETLARDGYDVRWLPFTKDDLRGFRYQVVRALDRIIKAEGVLIMHAQRHKAAFYATLAARKNSEVRLVTSVHGLNRSRSFLRKLGNRLLWPRINRIIAVSGAVKGDILLTNPWFPADRVEVVHNGIDLARFGRRDLDKKECRAFLGLPEHGWLWGAVGRLAPVKGHDVLLKAWAASGIGGLGGHLVIVGEGKLREELTALAQASGIAGEITLPGHVTDIPKFLAALDGFVMPSRHEGFPLAILEALAAGLPVVASGVGGIPEILTTLAERGYCFLVPPENGQELGEAMTQVMRWPAARREQAAAAIREQAQQFDGNRMIARLDAVYRGLVI
jgi:glycosyltransferase involved in cell wall biosynthesis